MGFVKVSKGTWSCYHEWSYQCNKLHKTPYYRQYQVGRTCTSHSKSHMLSCINLALNAHCTLTCTALHSLHKIDYEKLSLVFIKNLNLLETN